MTSKLDLIATYNSFGWQMIPVHAGGKSVKMQKGQTYADIATKEPDDLKGNIGIILGEVSGWLVDVDIDDERALAYCDRFLPETPAVFGRKSKPSSHWLYNCPQARTCKYYADVQEKGSKRKPIEIRASASEQTVFPPSIHPSKEPIAWNDPTNIQPAPIDFDELQRAVATMAIVPIIERGWTDGSRNDVASAISGFLLKHEVPLDLVIELITVVCENTGDDDMASRVALAQRADSRLAEDKPVKGFIALQELLGDEQATLISKAFKVRKALLRDQSGEVDYVLVDNDVIDSAAIIDHVVDRQRQAPTLYSINGLPSILHNSNTTFVTVRNTENLRLTINRNIVVGSKNADGITKACKSVPENLLGMIKEMLWEDPDWLPKITSITASPFIDSHGIIQDRMGYHELDEVYSFNTFKLSEINTNPSKADVKAAIAIIDDVVQDFPFAHESDKAHCYAYLMLPFIREQIKGLTPLHFVDKPIQGTGGTLLCQIGGAIANGTLLPPTMLPRTEEEFGKVITAKSKSSNQHMFFDNVRVISSDHYASMLTSDYCEGRLLGKSEMVEIKNNFIHIMSGNNIVMDADFNRRMVRILLDANVLQPEKRTFNHPYLYHYIKENRGTIIGAIMTIIANWFALGKPAFTGKRKASFEEWSEVIGGILESAGIQGFLATPDDEHSNPAVETADIESQFAAMWFSMWLPTKRTFTARELYEAAKADELDIVHGYKGEHTVRSFAKLLSASFKRRIKTIHANNRNNPTAAPVAVSFKCDCFVVSNQLEWSITPLGEVDLSTIKPADVYSSAL